MDPTRGLSREGVELASATLPAAAARCRSCGGAASTQPLAIAQLGEAEVVRCLACGWRGLDREGSDPPRPRPLDGPGASLPYFEQGALIDPQDRVAEPGDGGDRDASSAAAALVAATEREALSALASQLVFVTSSTAQPYLDRLATEAARTLGMDRESWRVVLFEDDRSLAMALESGEVLVSRGALALLEDEAELAFLLLHELAHVRAGDAGSRLVALGLAAATRAPSTPRSLRWLEATMDLLRLGHGAARELAADRLALRALVAWGYDAAAARRSLERLETLLTEGDARVAEVGLAHPPPALRMASLEKALRECHDVALADRSNREVFRRMVRGRAAEEALERYRPFPELAPRSVPARSPWPWIAGGIAALTLIFLLVARLLGD